jgi:hypothetical protein
VERAESLLESWRAAPLAEVSWLSADGRPEIAVVVPLIEEARPVMALTYDRLREARRLAAAGQVVLGVHAFAGARAPLAGATVTVAEDPTGTSFAQRLLAQELAKHPPSRELADSLLLRSEHWWYLPRLLVSARPRGPLRPPAPRRDALAAVATASGLELWTVDLDEATRRPRLRPEMPDGPLTVLQHGAELPDLDRRWSRRWWGTAEGGRLLLDGWEERGVGRRPGVWRRWRDEVALGRACRAGLRAAGHD